MSPVSALARLAADVPAPPLAARLLGLASDDEAAANLWRRDMQVEQLVFQELPQLAKVGLPTPDALVLFLARSLTDQLGRLRDLRSRYPEAPMIVVGRALRDLDQVLALEMGADDVLDAGLGAPVVAAKLRALWRRTAPGKDSVVPARLSFGALQLLRAQRCVLLNARQIDLTEGEFEVLWLLALSAGQTVSRLDLLLQLQGLRDAGPDRSIDCRVYRIRAKLGDRPGASQHIRTIRNRGYLFSPAAD